jgi:alpha-tubulin suppressor-like RCC1 family protein
MHRGRSLAIAGCVALSWIAGCGGGSTGDDDGGGADAPTSDGHGVCAADRDCDDGTFCNGRERCMPGPGADASGCRTGNPPCATGQTCEEAEPRCVTMCPLGDDADGDGEIARECGGPDCDDSDVTRYSTAAETCDGDDEDCDPTTFGARDADADGFDSDACCNGTLCGRDCDDGAGGVHPGVPEVCNGRDDDCDGAMDEGALRYFFPDTDGDGWGDRGAMPTPACAPSTGLVENTLDCDDTTSSVAPGRSEVCDLADNDCDGTTDEALATALACADLYGSPPNTSYTCSAAGACTIATGDCATDWANCDGEPSDGCETHLATDAASCGACGTSCGVGGVCAAGSCDGATYVSAGVDSTCAVRGARGLVACWGDNDYGQLGDGTITPRTTPVLVVGLLEPAMEVRLNTIGVTPGANGSACARTAGAVYCWGTNYYGQLGTGSTVPTSALTPRVVPGFPTPSSGLSMSIGTITGNIDVTFQHVCASQSWIDGTPRRAQYCWGNNFAGQITPFFGIGTVMPPTSSMTWPSTSEDMRVAAGMQHTCFLGITTREVRCFGNNARFALGTTGSGTSSTISAIDFVEIDAGWDFNCARRSGGGVRCWGADDHGQLGDGAPLADRAAPADVTGLGGATGISVGTRHACAVLGSGQVWCWGRNSSGQLGNGTTTDSAVPVMVSGLTDARQVSAGGDHSCAIRATGRVVCWGRNDRGQLGNGTMTQSPVPVVVSSF